MIVCVKLRKLFDVFIGYCIITHTHVAAICNGYFFHSAGTHFNTYFFHCAGFQFPVSSNKYGKSPAEYTNYPTCVGYLGILNYLESCVLEYSRGNHWVWDLIFMVLMLLQHTHPELSYLTQSAGPFHTLGLIHKYWS